MKTVKKIALVLITLLFLGACDDPIEYDPGDKDQTQKTQFHLDAEIADEAFDAQKRLHLETTEIASCNLAKSIDVSVISDVAISQIANQNGLKEFELQNGQINFIVPSTGCQLVGSLNGKVIEDSGRIIIDANISVTCGTGTLIADDGQLRLTITGTWQDGNVDVMNYKMDIDGYLVKRN
jgi:hypothetical protein